MVNPIQSVLAAEQAAQEAIENARGEAEGLQMLARRRAREIIERSEARTHRAVLDFERRQNRAIKDEIHDLRNRRRLELRQLASRTDAMLAGLVDELVSEFWPAPPEQEPRHRSGD